MPYQASLHHYTLPEFFREPPREWSQRLAEIAPEMPNMDRLVFRFMEPTHPDGTDKGWQHPERGQWVLYSAKDIRLVERDRAAQFEKHWSELFTEGEQEARKAIVSDYQHFMWHAKGVYVRPFLILQGEWGGTPAKYTEKEIAFLQASGALDEPFPVGSFPACPFDERTVKMIAMRDRLLQCSNSYEAVAKLDTAESMRNETEEAQRHKRATYLKTWSEMMQPSVEFMQRFIFTKEADRVLPRAPEGTADAVAQYKEHWLEHGVWIGAGVAGQRQVQVSVL